MATPFIVGSRVTHRVSGIAPATVVQIMASTESEWAFVRRVNTMAAVVHALSDIGVQNDADSKAALDTLLASIDN